jgi:outer membrane protein TolC
VHTSEALRVPEWVKVALLLVLAGIGGCARSNPALRSRSGITQASRANSAAVSVERLAEADAIALVAYNDLSGGEEVALDNAKVEMGADTQSTTEGTPRSIKVAAAPEPKLHSTQLSLADVVGSIHSTFPLLESAYLQNEIAAGNQTAAWGAFDTKLKAASESGPLGFYETYRNSAGLSRAIYHGGEVFGGYRVGRGEFQPWYLERQTNDGGELKAGISVPLLRNREIDARRAQLWRSTYDRQQAEPEIRAQLIRFVRDGSIAYWNWVAAGRQYEIGKQALRLAEQRNAKLKRRVEEGDVDPPVFQDNLRAIAKREAKLVDLQRKLNQAGIKLSLFYRADDGTPLVPEQSKLNTFPEPDDVSEFELEMNVALALEKRPELAALDASARRVNVDLAEARNDLLPSLDAQLIGSQDVGAPASKKRDKSQFELEAGLFIEIPVQRRKARGKSQVARGKLGQISAKRRFTHDKIRAEIQSAQAALLAAFERLAKARESKRLAEYMADVERRKFDVGQSNLLSVVLREQYSIEAADDEVDALLEYFSAKAEFDAAMARDGLQVAE